MKYIFILIFFPFTINNCELKNTELISIKENKCDIKDLPLTISNLLYVLNYYKVKYPDIVVRQYILETGWGKSNACKKNNNLFGLTNPRNKKYFKFSHWSDSVKGYRDMVQYKYKNGDYFNFLKNLPYAEDKKYISKLKSIRYDI